MQNRMAQYFSSIPSNTAMLELRPELKLSSPGTRPFRVDMERFFEFSFSFAEALVDLEDRFQPAFGQIGISEDFDDLEVDARWM